MAFQYSVAVRNARLDQVEATTGASAFLRLYTGAEPANCAAAATGTMLVEIPLPDDWMDPASGGTKILAGVWTAASVAAGNVGYGRIYNNAKTVCHVQFNVTVTGGGGDVTMDSIVLASGQTVVVNAFTLTAQNA